jgi:integrative and conjugative element protein (TIGR02256 family)
MGRRVGADLWLVDFALGPGPMAKHERYRFSPDLDWQHARIADQFRASNGRSTYLGDWHSHPRASGGGLSALDIGALKTIIAAPEAMCSEPLMMILWGGEPEWAASAWCARRMRRRFIGHRFDLRACSVSVISG